MKTKILRALAAWLLGMSMSAQAAFVGYSIDITTFYQFGVPPDLTFSDFGAASPDTGYWRVTNTGTTTFSGTIGQVAVSGSGGGDFSYSHVVALAPGSSVVFAVNSEASNFGGYGGATGTFQTGVEIFLTGLFEGIEAVDLRVFDKDIHSGVPRDVNSPPSGCTGAPLITDAYVLQGGHPTGCDTLDDYEVTQAPGRFSFLEIVGSAPEPATLALLGLGLAGLAASRRRKQ